MKIEPRRPPSRVLMLVIEFIVITGICALWLLIFFGVFYLLALAAVHW